MDRSPSAPTSTTHVPVGYWSSTGHRDFRHTPLELRQIYPQELPLLLEAGGLQLTERFGDFDGNPLAAESHRQVCICTVA